jgi:hypothetical protein
MTTFGERLRAERQRLGYGVTALARAADAFAIAPPYDRDQVRHWHTRTHGPRLDALAYLAHLGFDVHYLLSGKPQRQSALQPSDGVGNLCWPLETVHILPAPIVWCARDVQQVIALRRETLGSAPSRVAVLRTFSSTLYTRAMAALEVPVPECTPALAQRASLLFDAWAHYFRITLPLRCTSDDAANAVLLAFRDTQPAPLHIERAA